MSREYRGDWIKMRGSLLRHPKVIVLAGILSETKPFTEWAEPGNNGRLMVSDSMLQYATLGALLICWSAAREHGVPSGGDLLLESINEHGLDLMAGIPGFGTAMKKAGWARDHPEGVILPDFMAHNEPPKSSTERSRMKRQRDADATGDPSRNSRKGTAEALTRDEMRKEKKERKESRRPPSGHSQGSLPPDGSSREAFVAAENRRLREEHEKRDRNAVPKERVSQMLAEIKESHEKPEKRA